LDGAELFRLKILTNPSMTLPRHKGASTTMSEVKGPEDNPDRGKRSGPLGGASFDPGWRAYATAFREITSRYQEALNLGMRACVL
jgi:hypothetical protein